MQNIYRHGDVLLQSSTKEVNKVKGVKKLILAYGEVTNHHHLLTTSGMIYGTPELFMLTKPGVLTHEEHNPIELPAGTYEMSREEEFDPFEEQMRKVID